MSKVGISRAALRIGHVVVFLPFVSANRYCAFEIDGDHKYYVCPRTENCCSIGCCRNNLAFHFYQLWYYWLVILFLFMICSGGGWWYRFCRGARIPPNSSTGHHSRYSRHYQNTTLTSNTRTNRPPYADRHCPQHQSSMAERRVLHRTCAHQRQYYYLQHIWKTTDTNVINQQPIPPSYSYSIVNLLPEAAAAATAGTAVARELGPSSQRRAIGCPYYQLYGPPPSYDSVVQFDSGGAHCQLVISNLPTPAITRERRTEAEESIHNVGVSEQEPASNSNTCNSTVVAASISVKCNSTSALGDYNSNIIGDPVSNGARASGPLMRSYSADCGSANGSELNFENVAASTSSAT